VAPADFRLIREIVLRQAFGMSQTAKVASEYFPQVHAGSETTCSKYAPRYTDQNEGLISSRPGNRMMARALLVRMINPDLELFMAKRAQSQVIELSSSHAVFLVHAREVAA
jgi:hypothetical protein